mmetsp:Transcript_38524/g.57752  ORF Transcript_38524/g.57752 Transcript_38524/m.57752 type:complete len:842 (-) Transcript_38524:213-2738(-)
MCVERDDNDNTNQMRKTQILSSAPTKAHKQSSSFATIDPVYSCTQITPSPDIVSHPSNDVNASENDMSSNSHNSCWLYGEAELECHGLFLLKTKVKEANLNVWYPGLFHTPSNHVQFRCLVQNSSSSWRERLRLRAVGNVTVILDNNEIYRGKASDEEHCIDLTFQKRKDADYNLLHDNHKNDTNNETSSSTLLVDLINEEEEGEPPAMLIQDGYFATTIDNGKWQWRSQKKKKKEENETNDTVVYNDWSTPMPFSKTISGIPPHKVELPSVVLLPEKEVIHPSKQEEEEGSDNGQLFDFGREILGYISFSCSSNNENEESNVNHPPSLYVGESIAEAIAENLPPEEYEQSTELVQPSTDDDENDKWTSKHILAFRYVCIISSSSSTKQQHTIKNVSCHACFHPVQYHGAFSCSDTLLTQIWMHSAYTLRLCMHQHFILDGIKRDRLPWTGDIALSLMVNAYCFKDKDVVMKSLVALCRGTFGGDCGVVDSENRNDLDDINGIVDYSLWWIIAEDLYQLYFSDMGHLTRQWVRIKNAMEILIQRCDDDDENDGMLLVDLDKQWLFIDWADDVQKIVSLQILWWWAQVSGAALADRMKDSDTAKLWRSNANSLAQALYLNAWDDDLGVWRGLLEDNKGNDGTMKISRHANVLAIISGFTKSSGTTLSTTGIKTMLLRKDIPPVGTPYMKAFECMALCRLGETKESICNIRSYWGGMLEKGATTFWEAYNHDEKDDEAYAFYGRPFGKSLCHAWGSGPAMLLPSTLLGIRPTADGWKEFTVACDLAGLESVCASVPTPYGNICVEIDGNKVNIHVPGGTTLDYCQRRWIGPMTISQLDDNDPS